MPFAARLLKKGDIAISQAAGQQKKHSQKRLVQDFAEP